MSHQGAPGGGGGTPWGLVGSRWPPPSGSWFQYFFIYSIKNLQEVSSNSKNFYFFTKNNTMVVLLKTTSVRVSSIQIMQIRVQNKSKSVWKSRYDGDVSGAHGDD